MLPCVSHLCAVYGYLLISNWDARLIPLHSLVILCNSRIRFFFWIWMPQKIPKYNSFPSDTHFFVFHLLLSRCSNTTVWRTFCIRRALYAYCNFQNARTLQRIQGKQYWSQLSAKRVGRTGSLKLLDTIFMCRFLHPHEHFFCGIAGRNSLVLLRPYTFSSVWYHQYEA